jgi:hypothetical protein
MMIAASGSGAGVFGSADKVVLSGGGEVLLRDLHETHTAVGHQSGVIFDISVRQVSASGGLAPSIYFFKTRPTK